MPESQQHGFTVENHIKECAYGISQVGGYTQTHDIPAADNKLDGVSVSIKTSGSQSVDMGDARRVFDACSSGEPFHMLLYQYKQEKDEKVCQNLMYVDLTSSREELFGAVTSEDINSLHEHLKAIPHGKASTDTCIKYKGLTSQLRKKSGAISLRPKVDSKKQRRLQCSFSNIKKFCEKYPTRLLYENKQGIFKGVQLLTRILSPRRKRSKRMN